MTDLLNMQTLKNYQKIFANLVVVLSLVMSFAVVTATPAMALRIENPPPPAPTPTPTPTPPTSTNGKLFSVCPQNPTSTVCQEQAQQNQNPTDSPLNHLIKVATDLVALLTGAAAVIIIIVSGIKFVTAGGTAPGQRAGDPNQIKSARQTLTAAILGLVIVALAWAVITYLTDKLIIT